MMDQEAWKSNINKQLQGFSNTAASNSKTNILHKNLFSRYSNALNCADWSTKKRWVEGHANLYSKECAMCYLEFTQHSSM